jgi:hypothetical protein
MEGALALVDVRVLGVFGFQPELAGARCGIATLCGDKMGATPDRKINRKNLKRQILPLHQE